MPRSTVPSAAFPVAAAPLRVRRVSPDAPGRWLQQGFRDAIAHPAIGLAWGLGLAVVGWLLVLGLARAGMAALVLPLAGGFLLVAPVAVAGLTEVSRRRELGLAVTPAAALAAMVRNRQLADLGLVLLLIFFVWIQVALVLSALFFGSAPPAPGGLVSQVVLAPRGVPFLAAGTAIGGVFAALAFAVSAVSVPLLLDRDVSAVAAMRTSVAAVWLNRKIMVGWAATLATLGFLGLAFLFVGLAATMPIAAHASWHAYRDLVERA